MTKIIAYFEKRVLERSFWVGVGLAITAAAALPYPWNYYALVAGLAGSLVPDGKVNRP